MVIRISAEGRVSWNQIFGPYSWNSLTYSSNIKEQQFYKYFSKNFVVKCKISLWFLLVEVLARKWREGERLPLCLAKTEASFVLFIKQGYCRYSRKWRSIYHHFCNHNKHFRHLYAEYYEPLNHYTCSYWWHTKIWISIDIRNIHR